ncbi:MULTISPECIES: prolyl oligopeptidase family serine peptidase [Bacillaceae]|uniref:alpha/beta hydrolase family protein n=1 Tax=Bacillaceae TaxID=186817 RepID=UPI00104DD6B4|nr:prolyl oligopeptidase family serine peptidase [Bacillus sp. CBEL-1]TDB55329.1 S9 family peptidase [Bacillus sp. CBEL-1]
MKKWGFIVLLTIAVLGVTAVFYRAESGDVNKEKVHLFSPYASNVDIYQITYPSDGLQVKGFLLQPKDIVDKKYPLLVYNRGGNREHGMIRDKTLRYLSSWADKGYVVVTTQYRGNGGSEGVETYGGDDIHDVLNLIKWGEQLPYVNPEQKVALGYSRGGMMTYLTMKNGISFDAVVVQSGITDMFQFYDQRGSEMKQVLRDIVGDPKMYPERYKSRSVVYWSDKVNSPLLILQGDHDKKVHHTQAEKLVAQLEEQNKEYKYVLYKGGNHPLSNYYNEYNAEIDKWFQQHLVE